MGVRNYLVEGVSCAGKTTVATELERRGHHVVHGDRVLAYQGDPVTGEPLPGHHHEHHVWDVDAVRRIVADHSRPVTFLCGGSRNHARFVDLLDGVLVLELDAATLAERLDARPADEFGVEPRGARAGAAAARQPRGPARRRSPSTRRDRWPRWSTRSSGSPASGRRPPAAWCR